MSGTSDQEKAYSDLIGKSEALSSKVDSTNFDVKNLFDNYASPYSAGSQMGELSNYYDKERANANNQFGYQADKAGSDTGKMVASKGLTGSLAMDSVNNAKNNVLSQKYDYLGRLATGESSGRLGVMKNANDEKLRLTGANQSVLNQNMDNLFKKFGLQSGALSQQGGFAQGLDNTTAWDDMLQAASVASKFVPLPK